ncbi:MAG: hypothetical protein WC378_05345 [Opitutaceae bacterium]|jgi:hypothetical protein
MHEQLEFPFSFEGLHGVSILGMTIMRKEYFDRCRMRHEGICFENAAENWHLFSGLRKYRLEPILRAYKRDSGLQDVTGRFRNPDHTLSSALWAYIDILPGCLDFEEHYQKAFLARGLVIYCSLLLESMHTDRDFLKRASSPVKTVLSLAKNHRKDSQSFENVG